MNHQNSIMYVKNNWYSSYGGKVFSVKHGFPMLLIMVISGYFYMVTNLCLQRSKNSELAVTHLLFFSKICTGAFTRWWTENASSDTSFYCGVIKETVIKHVLILKLTPYYCLLEYPKESLCASFCKILRGTWCCWTFETDRWTRWVQIQKTFIYLSCQKCEKHCPI